MSIGTDTSWGDLLTSYKGHTITYDAIGNPLTYYGRTAYTFTWKNGRQLATATANGKTLSFTYNDQGLRLTKTVDGVTHTYSLDGDRIVAEEWGNQLLVYFYDDAGLPMGMMYRNSSYADKQFDYYLYEKDVFGNIIAIYNANGTKVASYCYDAWGNCTVLTNTNGIGTLNPFRYRGYYLDTETNLYYLQSRYYDSYVGRFINADGTINGNGDLIGYNLFAYCSNNPVMYTDYSGEGWIRDFLEKAKNFLGKIFGAEYTASETVTIDKVDEFSQWSPVSYTVGVDGTVVVKQMGDSSKPISVYVDHDLLDFKKSTIGFKINIASFTFTYSFGLDNISISGSITDGDVTKSIGFRTSIVDLKYGIEVSTTTKMPDGFRKEYVNSSVNGQGLLLLALFLSGQPAPAPNPVYAH